MAIIINDPNAFDLWGKIGEDYGQSLAKSMNVFTQQKMQDIQNRRAIRNFMNMGYSPQEAQALTYFKDNPKQLSEMMGTFGFPGQGQNQNIPQDNLASYYQQMGTGLQQPMQQPLAASYRQQPQLSLEQLQQLQQQGLIPQQQAQEMMQRQQQPVQQQREVPQQRGSYQPVYQAPKPGYGTQVPGRRYSPTVTAAAEKLQQAEQKRIDVNTKQFNDQIDKAADEALEMKLKAQEALDIIARGNRRSGVSGLLPLGLTMANSDTRVLDKIYAELAASVAAKGAGP